MSHNIKYRTDLRFKPFIMITLITKGIYNSWANSNWVIEGYNNNRKPSKSLQNNNTHNNRQIKG
jgi:hypothetical protein